MQEDVAFSKKNQADTVKRAVIKDFEMAHELAWKLMQDILRYEGESEILGSRSATRLAFSRGLIEDGRIWLEMVDSRNRSVHTYDHEILQHEFQLIIEQYLPLFVQFSQKVEKLCQTLDSQNRISTS